MWGILGIDLVQQQAHTSILMIKYILINRLSDGLILCQTSQPAYNEPLQKLKHQIKTYHRQQTSKHRIQSESSTSSSSSSSSSLLPLKQIANPGFGIYYRISGSLYVVVTIVVEVGYPVKLANGFVQAVAGAFFDQAKCLLGGSNLASRIQNIEGSHYFVRFDRILKSKKKQFQDPTSIKNIDRMKKQLQSIQQIMKQNMDLMDRRHSDLLNAQDQAHKINEESKLFQKKSKNLVWHLWFRKNVIWLVVILAVLALYFLI